MSFGVKRPLVRVWILRALVLPTLLSDAFLTNFQRLSPLTPRLRGTGKEGFQLGVPQHSNWDQRASLKMIDSIVREVNIVTFDIDGTICVSDQVTEGVVANAMHRNAFTHALKTVCGFENSSIDEVHHHGMTDPLILLKIQLHRGMPYEEACANIEPLKAAMVTYAMANKALPTTLPASNHSGLVLLPGVKELLEALHARQRTHSDVVIGLVTGNLEPIAWSKMEALGIRHLFTEPPIGGFGSDFCGLDITKGAEDRAELVSVASKRVELAFPNAKIARRVHIGDAPNDVSAAHIAGVEAVGVTTGIFTREQLLQAVPSCLVFADLSETDKVLSVLGLRTVPA